MSDRTAEHQRHEWRRAAERHRRERTDIFSRSWKGQGDLLNATRSVLAAQQAQEKAALADRQKLERAELRRVQRFPPFKAWLTERSPEFAQEWRHRERQPAAIEGPAFEPPAPRDIRAFQAVIDGGTHHMPAPESVPPRFARSAMNAFFVSDMTSHVRELQPKLWIHGHTHDRCDYLLGETRVVANPLGYPNEVRSLEAFEPAFHMEI